MAAQDRQLSGKEKKARLAAALRDGQRIIIDLDYADLMTDQARLWWALTGSACAVCML
jgi:urease accessory protein UreE